MKNLFILLVFPVMIWSCSNSDDDQVANNCDSNVIVDNNLYGSIQNDALFQILNAEIIGDCLELELSSSGCDGSNWQVDLIDADIVQESFPAQRSLKISFENPELCQAIVSRSFSFNIQALQIDQSSIILNLEAYEEQLVYEY